MPEGHTDPRAARPASGEALRTIAELVEQREATSVPVQRLDEHHRGNQWCHNSCAVNARMSETDVFMRAARRESLSRAARRVRFGDWSPFGCRGVLIRSDVRFDLAPSPLEKHDRVGWVT